MSEQALIDQIKDLELAAEDRLDELNSASRAHAFVRGTAFAYRKIASLLSEQATDIDALSPSTVEGVDLERSQDPGQKPCGEQPGATLGATAALAGWMPITEAAPRQGEYIAVRTVETYRWLAYKPDGARQMRAKGRWQMFDGYGWRNAPLPEGAEWRPVRAAAAEMPATDAEQVAPVIEREGSRAELDPLRHDLGGRDNG